MMVLDVQAAAPGGLRPLAGDRVRQSAEDLGRDQPGRAVRSECIGADSGCRPDGRAAQLRQGYGARRGCEHHGRGQGERDSTAPAARLLLVPSGASESALARGWRLAPQDGLQLGRATRHARARTILLAIMVLLKLT